MKRYLLPFLLVVACASKGSAQMKVSPASSPPPQQQPAQPMPGPNAGKFKFVEDTHDYGEVPEGPVAECDFEFTNTGKSPIVIKEAHGSCGCTVPEWPKEPVLPNHKGVIHVRYNTKSRPGPINKQVTITSDAQTPVYILQITGMVKAAPAGQQGKPADK